PDDKDTVYRIKTFLGWFHPHKDFGGGSQKKYEDGLKKCMESLSQASRNIVVLHDRNSYFRRLKEDQLQEVLKRQVSSNTGIVWRMDSPLAEGNLWKVFQNNNSWLDRTVAVVKAECLRMEGANLPEYISLERESQNLLKGLETVERLKALAEVRHLVVHFPRQVWLVVQRFEAGSNCILSAPCECSPAAKANVQPKYATSTMR